MKVRLVGGPFGGQVKTFTPTDYGRNEIVLRAPKKLTRRQRYEMLSAPTRYGQSSVFLDHSIPIVEARYRIAMRPHHNGTDVLYAPCQHPDGSLFYEYVDKSKRELA